MWVTWLRRPKLASSNQCCFSALSGWVNGALHTVRKPQFQSQDVAEAFGFQLLLRWTSKQFIVSESYPAVRNVESGRKAVKTVGTFMW